MAIPKSIEILTAEQAALEVGCTSTWIRRLLKDDKLKGRQTRGGAWLIDARDLEAVREALTTRAVSRRDASKNSRKKKG